MNRIILGSIVAGIAVMMTASIIVPAYAENPWKERWLCQLEVGGFSVGTESYVTGLGDACKTTPTNTDCPTNSGADGTSYWRDLNRDDIKQSNETNTRCVRA
jgi:hypothetical protein